MKIRSLAIVFTLAALFLGDAISQGNSSHASASQPALVAVASSVGRAVLKYFGKESFEEGTEYLAKQGGKQLVQRVTTKAAKQGGDDAVEQVARYVGKHGPDALKALDNAPSLGPVLSALDEIPATQVQAALAKLAAGTTGRELAETVSKHGAKALTSELMHPGVGMALVRSLGDDGAELATKLTKGQAITVAKHVDDLAKLPSTQRNGVVAMFRKDADRMTSFLGDFVKANPGKSLFTVATTTIVLAEPERILGGDEVVFDADGNPIVVSKGGIVGRSIEATGNAAKHVSDGYIRPLYLTLIAFLGTFFALWLMLKLWHTHKREKLKTQSITDKQTATIDAKNTSTTTKQ
ncbi:hypothetical protein [Planctomycetes bacterium K23_9]|uniref:DUF937 domain-containing protein n=1 Tax=Stieleria marina TaxID=1930275 RepID=A0A517P1F1_9BACT|nr:hypothetical protein K239x_52150 [Planctomycetes bacterium K23_9]